MGPRCAKLAVKDPQRFRFDRSKLMASMAKIVTQLGAAPAFVAAVRRWRLLSAALALPSARGDWPRRPRCLSDFRRAFLLLWPR